jgi:hypothetical protein
MERSVRFALAVREVERSPAEFARARGVLSVKPAMGLVRLRAASAVPVLV